MSGNNKMPELAPTDIVQLRDGRYGIVLMNNMASKGLSIFTYFRDKSKISCKWHLDIYSDNICERDHHSDIIKIWKSNAQTQLSLMNSFFNYHKEPGIKPDWVEPKVKPRKNMTMEEIEAILGYSITIVTKHEKEEESEP